MRKNSEWHRLDNAAKIFPPNSNKRDTKVFRFSCELREPIKCDLLQQALDKTIQAYPLFHSVIKRGLFWYYLENSDIAPVVCEEYRSPCSMLYDCNIKTLLFSVTYYKKRINFEVYHALTDGTGALQFLRYLTFQYLLLAHAADFTDNLPIFDVDSSRGQKADDSFSKYYLEKSDGAKKSRRGKRVKAFQMKGQKISEYRIRVISGNTSAAKVLVEAHKYQTTLTIFITAILICAIGQEMSKQERTRPVVVSVPVNLRNFFVSETARNFFSVMNVGYDFGSGEDDLGQVIAAIKAFMQDSLTQEQMQARLNSLSALEHNIFARAIPRVLKDVVLKFFHDRVAEENTVSVSSIGKIDMPEQMREYINLFDVFISTNKLQLCMCSYRDELTLSLTSSFVNSEVEKNFFRMLTERGIEVTIATNTLK